MNNKSQLREILSRHEGQAQAITSRALCFLLNETDRSLRLTIRELRAEGFPVLSSGEGYYLPSNWEELRRCVDSMRGRLIEDARTRRDILRAGALYLKPAKQLKLC